MSEFDREQRISKRAAISSGPDRTSGPRGNSIRACAAGARHSAKRPKSRVNRAERNASGADWKVISPTVATAHSANINRSVDFPRTCMRWNSMDLVGGPGYYLNRPRELTTTVLGLL